MHPADIICGKKSRLGPRDSVGLPTDYFRPKWYAACTCASHGKRNAEQLCVQSVEHFILLYESVRRSKGRRMCLQLPLLPGCVFARFALPDRLQVLQIPSVARVVSFNGAPRALPGAELEALKAGLDRGAPAAPHPYLRIGRCVRVIAGPLQGLEGIVIR